MTYCRPSPDCLLQTRTLLFRKAASHLPPNTLLPRASARRQL